MDYQDVKKKMRGLTERIIADFNDYNHLTQVDRKLTELEKVIQYMEDKHILKLEKAKLAPAEFEAPVKKKVSKKKVAKRKEPEPEVADTPAEPLPEEQDTDAQE